jgi:hypothetical protein
MLLSPLKEQIPDEMAVIKIGRYSVIFHCYDEKKYIVLHCWLKEIDNLFDRYKKIFEFINNSTLEYFIKPKFFQDSVLVNNRKYPCISIDCSGGVTLKKFVQNNLQNKNVILQTADAFRSMVANLHKNSVAHGNLTDHHIIVFPKKRIQLKLINYDSMFIPELAAEKDIEKGHHCFQHTDRINQARLLNSNLDFFSELVIYLSLRCLAIDSYIWYKLGINDLKQGLLFCCIINEEFIISDSVISTIKSIAQNDKEIEYLLNKLIYFTKQERIDNLIPLEEILDDYHFQQQKIVNQENIFLDSFLSLTDVYYSMKNYLKNQEYRKLLFKDMIFLVFSIVGALILCFFISLMISNQNSIHDYWEAVFIFILLLLYTPLHINALQILYFSLFNSLSCYLANTLGTFILTINSNTHIRIITTLIFMFILFLLSMYIRQIIIFGFKQKKISHNQGMKIPEMNIIENIFKLLIDIIYINIIEKFFKLLIDVVYMIEKSFLIVFGACFGYILVHGLSETINLFASVKWMHLGLGTAIFYFFLFLSIFFFIKKSFDKIFFKLTSIIYMSIFCGITDCFIESLLRIMSSSYVNMGFSLAVLYASMAYGILLGMNNEEPKLKKNQMLILVCFIFFGAFIGDLIRDYLKEWLQLEIMENGGSAAVFFGIVSFSLLYGLKVITRSINRIQIFYFSFFVFISAYLGEWLRLFLIDQIGKGIFMHGVGTGFFYGVIGFGILFGFRSLKVLAEPIHLKSTRKVNIKK